MSRRGLIKLAPDEQETFLRTTSKVSLATVDKDGFPHVVAMSFVAKDGAIYLTSYAKAQKVLNVQRNPKVGLLIEAGNDYAAYQGVMIRGHCEVIAETRVVADTMHAIMTKDIQESTTPRPDAISRAAKRVVLKVTPEKVATWDHTKLGGKY